MDIAVPTGQGRAGIARLDEGGGVDDELVIPGVEEGGLVGGASNL